MSKPNTSKLCAKLYSTDYGLYIHIYPHAANAVTCVVDSRVHGRGPEADVLEYLPGALGLHLAGLGGLKIHPNTMTQGGEQKGEVRFQDLVGLCYRHKKQHKRYYGGPQAESTGTK